MYRNRALLVALVPLALVAGCSTDTAQKSPTVISPAGSGPSAPSSATAGTSAGTAPRATDPAPSRESPSAATKAPVAGDQKIVLNRLPGTANTGCVTVGQQADVRSGSIAVGNFTEARTAVTKGGVNGADVNFYVIPADTGSMPGVQLKATSPTGSVRTVTSKQVGQAEEWSYYRVVLPVGGGGTWRLEFQAGKNSGCFMVAF